VEKPSTGKGVEEEERKGGGKDGEGGEGRERKQGEVAGERRTMPHLW